MALFAFGGAAMVSVADTAAATQDTAEGAGQTPPAQPTETVQPGAVTETVAPQPTETDEPKAAEAPPDERPKGIDDLSDEELVTHPRFKDHLAKAAESERQQRLDEVQRQNNRARQAWFDSGRYTLSLAQAASVNEDGAVVVDPRKASEIGNDMWEAASFGAFDTLDQIVRSREPEGYRMPRETADKLARTRSDVDAGRKPLNALVEARLEAYEQARDEVRRTELRTEIERDVRKEFEAKAETARLRAAEQQQQAQPTPSRGTGSAGRTWATQREIDTAVAKGDLPLNDYRQMRYDGSYDALPW